MPNLYPDTVKRVMIPYHDLEGILKKRCDVRTFPKDGQIVRVYFDSLHAALCLIVASNDFEPVSPGNEIPVTELLLETRENE